MFTFLKNNKNSSIKTSFDTYNFELNSMGIINCKGLNYYFSKVLTPFLQISTSGSYNKSKQKPNHTFSISNPSSYFQFSFDNSNLELRSSFVKGLFITKIHSIIPRNFQAFNQVETLYNSRLFNVAFKLVLPVLTSDLIYVLNFSRLFGDFNIGTEIVGRKNELGISLNGRYEKKNNIVSMSLQRFNKMTLGFYRRLFNGIELGAELEKGQNLLNYKILTRVKNYKTDIRYFVSNNLRMGFNWNERLTENFGFEFGCCYDFDEFEYGLGINYES